MSKKLGVLGNYLTVIDSASAFEEWTNPTSMTTFGETPDGLGVILKSTVDGVEDSDVFTYAELTDVNGDAWANELAVRTFLRDNTGDTVTKAGLDKTQVLVTDNKTLVVNDAQIVQVIATDAKVFTMPLITAAMVAAGTEFHFVNNGADDAVALTLAPDALDAFHGTIANAAADKVAGGVVDKDWVNTKATANKGDYCKAKAMALTEWHITAGVGIWASEA